MQTLIQILKRNEPRDWKMADKNGKEITGISHTAECLLLNDDGSVEQVGVLKLKTQDLKEKGVPGTFRATFTLQSNPASRQIEAVLTDLMPLVRTEKGFVEKPVAPLQPAKA